MKILLFESSPSDATSYYRSRGVLSFLRNTGVELVPCETNNFHWSDAVMGDIAFFHRPHSNRHLKAMLTCKDVGIPIIADYDDDLFNIEDHNPMYQLYANDLQNILDCLRLSDEVIVSTQALADEYSKYARCTVIPNAHNDFIFPVDKKQPFIYNCTAYYRGGSTHQHDVYKHKKEIITMLERNEEFKFYFIGDRFSFLEEDTPHVDNFFYCGYEPLITYLSNLNKLRPCAHFTFLQNTQFNQGKSNCSWLEATYAGAASFAPEGLAEFDKTPAIKCTNFAMAFAVYKPETLLKRSHDESWQYIKDNLLLSNVNQMRGQLFNDVLCTKNNKS